MLLASNECDLLELLSVDSLVLLELLDFIFDLLSSGFEQVFDCIISPLDINLSVLDVLF